MCRDAKPQRFAEAVGRNRATSQALRRLTRRVLFSRIVAARRQVIHHTLCEGDIACAEGSIDG